MRGRTEALNKWKHQNISVWPTVRPHRGPVRAHTGSNRVFHSLMYFCFTPFILSSIQLIKSVLDTWNLSIDASMSMHACACTSHCSMQVLDLLQHTKLSLNLHLVTNQLKWLINGVDRKSFRMPMSWIYVRVYSMKYTESLNHNLRPNNNKNWISSSKNKYIFDYL